MTDEELADLLDGMAHARECPSLQRIALRTASFRLRARSEDTERLDHMERVCAGASSSDRYLPFQIYWGDGKGIRAAIDSARKRGE